MHVVFLIGIDDLVYVNAAIANLAERWMDIGDSLGVGKSYLNKIFENHQRTDVGICLIEMLADWLKNNNCTWSDVVEVVKRFRPNSAQKIAENLKGIPYIVVPSYIML